MMDNTDLEKIGLYFRGFFIRNTKNLINLDDLGINFRLLESTYDLSFKVFYGIKICDQPPTINLRKIESEFNKEGEPYNFKYPLYFFEFKIEEAKYLFCCLPDIFLMDFLFPNIVSDFYKFDLTKICANFFQLNNPTSIKLTRLNGKLNYDKNESITSISLFGKNNLQSNVIRRFLQLYPESSHSINPFDELPPLIEPKSCRINYNDNIKSFSLNVDSIGNFSFYLQNYNQFELFNEILNFIVNSEAFIKATLNPIKRSGLSLQKVE